MTIFWFRRDLRIEDNAGLFYALKENKDVQPLFIFDVNILREKQSVYFHRNKDFEKSSY